jgi:hypothetical protein
MVRDGFKTITACALLSVLLFAGADARASATSSIRGRASLGGVLVEEIDIRAYAHRSGSFGPLTGEPIAGSARTATDGTYKIELPPGRYVVEALKKLKGNTADKPEPGDLYCLYSGSPITVAAGRSTWRVKAHQGHRQADLPGREGGEDLPLRLQERRRRVSRPR